MQTMIRRYVRDKRRNPVGVLIAYKTQDGEVVYGWSKCNTKEDRFNKVHGVAIAFNRAVGGGFAADGKRPRAVEKLWDKFVARATKYFKVEPAVEPA